MDHNVKLYERDIEKLTTIPQDIRNIKNNMANNTRNMRNNIKHKQT